MSAAPGPWRLRVCELHEGGQGLEIVDAEGQTVCDNQTYYPHALDACNAPLIESAPELLRALKALREATTEAYKVGRIDALVFVEAGNIIAQAEREL